VYLKHYSDDASRHRAEQNYRWLASLPGPLRLPQLHDHGGPVLAFEDIRGRPAEPGDLVMLASHLGAVHAATYIAELQQARLGEAFCAASGHEIPGFLGRRLEAVARELEAGRVPGPAFSTGQACALLRSACGGPAAFYKDANLRNFLITPTGPVTVDFDDLTLAPFGYDLAKLVVSLSMTYGALGSAQINAALGTYNAATRRLPGVMPVAREQLMAWAEIHHILTSRYLGRAGYRHGWHEVRP
jgi:Phosphotransferase enzyme family